MADWQLSVDSTAVYFLRPNGRLSWVGLDNPVTQSQTDLALQVARFQILGQFANRDNGVLAVTEVRDQGGTLKQFFSRTSPAEVSLGRAFDSAFNVATDRRFTVFQPLWTSLGLGSVAVMNNTTREVCTLQPKLSGSVYNLGSFSQDSKWVSWMDFPLGALTADLWIGRPQGCTEAHLIGHNTMQKFLLDDTGLLFVDEWTPEKGGRLRYLAWGPDQAWPNRDPVTLHTSVDAVVEPRTGERLIPFTSVEPGQEGLYLLQLPR